MEPSHARADRYVATVEHIEKLNPETLKISMSCPDITHYRAGQYLKVYLEEDKARSYSLASAPGVDAHLQLHVRRGAAGSASRWFHEVLAPGDELRISAPQGYACYQPGGLAQPLLMIATGSGLAPFYGIARAALRHGHASPLQLYHGVRDGADLYLVEQLSALARLYPNFRYVPCVSGSHVPDGCSAGRALDIALREVPVSHDWRVYLSGNPAMVDDAWKAFLHAGVPPAAILSDYLPKPAATPAALAA